jgi:HAMP domain-containing protein
MKSHPEDDLKEPVDVAEAWNRPALESEPRLDATPAQTAPRFRFSLRFLLVMAFMVPLILAVGVLSMLYLRNSYQVAEALAQKIQKEIGAQVLQNLDAYLREPIRVLSTNQNIAVQGLLDLEDSDRASWFFWRQGDAFAGLGMIGFAGKQGDLVGANRSDQVISLARRDASGSTALQYYPVTASGERSDVVLGEQPGFDAREQEWYQNAQKNTGPVWSAVRAYDADRRLYITAASQYRDSSGQFQGVFLVELPLGQLNTFLQNLNTSTRGAVYIIEADGSLVASSSAELFYKVSESGQGGTGRLKATESGVPVIVSAQETIYTLYPDLKLVGRDVDLRFNVSGEPFYLHMTPYYNPYGLRWWIVTAVPEADFMTQVYQANDRTQVWSGAALGLALILSALLAAWVVHPLARLNKAAQVLASGVYQPLEIRRADEIGELAISFNHMARQVQESVTKLEARVAERTRMVETSAEISRRLSTILDPDQLVQAVVEQLQQAFHYYHVQIYLFDEHREVLRMVGGTGAAGREMLARGHTLLADTGLVGRAASLNVAVFTPNTLQDQGWLPNPLLPDTRSEVAVPIASGSHVLGVLDVQQNVLGGLGDADVQLIQTIAAQVAPAIQNARAYAGAQRQAQREGLIAAIGQKIQRAATVDEVLRVAVQELGQALEARQSSVEICGDADQLSGRNGNAHHA